MKAKEYAARYRALLEENKPKYPRLSGAQAESCTTIIAEFCQELLAMVKSRHCGNDAAVFSVMRELHQKWLTLCRIEPTLPDNGFALGIAIMMKDLWAMMPEVLRSELEK